MGLGDMEKFISGSVGYVIVTAGQTASYNTLTRREMNAVVATGGDATLTVAQYESFYDGAETVIDGSTLFGKFHSVTVVSGTVRIYSSGGAPTVV